MKKILLFLLVGLSLVGCSSESANANDYEGTVESYLKAVKNGDENATDFLDIGVDGLIDVFEYEYLQTLDEKKEKHIMEFPNEDYLENHRDEYGNYTEYKNAMKEKYPSSDVIEETYNQLVMWDGESYKNTHTLLYNVTLANGLGEKLYKKVEFDVQQTVVDSRIVGIEIR